MKAVCNLQLWHAGVMHHLKQECLSVKSRLQMLTSKVCEHNSVSNRILIALLYQAQHKLKEDNTSALVNVGYGVVFNNETPNVEELPSCTAQRARLQFLQLGIEGTNMWFHIKCDTTDNWCYCNFLPYLLYSVVTDTHLHEREERFYCRCCLCNLIFRVLHSTEYAV